jgi:hypothetical protein
MPDLTFRVEGAEAIPFAAAPLIAFQVRVENAIPDEAIHTVALRAQIQIDATRRRYTPEEKGNLEDLFGEPDRWSRTLRSMLWTHASTVITSFEGSTMAEMQVPCTFDFNVAATKYFHGITEGDIPLTFLFSGTVFYASQEANLRVTPIPWDREAKFKLPVKVWREMMELYYPNSAWLSLRKDVFERLYQYKIRKGIPTFEEALGGLLS